MSFKSLLDVFSVGAFEVMNCRIRHATSISLCKGSKLAVFSTPNVVDTFINHLLQSHFCLFVGNVKTF